MRYDQLTCETQISGQRILVFKDRALCDKPEKQINYLEISYLEISYLEISYLEI